MPGINFRKRFAEKVKAGEKTQTIRKRRTAAIKAGDHLTLWTGQRTKQCEPLGDATCTTIEPIKILVEKRELWLWDDMSEYQDENGQTIGNFYLADSGEAKHFAKLDGFDSIEDFFQFFKNYPSDILHFELVVIHWELGWKP